MDPNATTELMTAAALAGAVGRLICLNLAKRSPALVAYLAFVGLMDLGFGLLDAHSAFYFWSYVALEPLKWIFSIFAIRELFALTFKSYPGIRTVGRWAMYSGVILALGISQLVTRFFWGGGAGGRSADLFYFEVSQRSVVFTLAFVIVTILVFLSKYRLQLGKNTLVSCVSLSVILLGEASQLVIDSLAPKLYNLHIDFAESIFVASCILGWAAMLRPETTGAPERIAVSTLREDQLPRQLESLNNLMTRSVWR